MKGLGIAADSASVCTVRGETPRGCQRQISMHAWNSICAGPEVSGAVNDTPQEPPWIVQKLSLPFSPSAKQQAGQLCYGKRRKNRKFEIPREMSTLGLKKKKKYINSYRKSRHWILSTRKPFLSKGDAINDLVTVLKQHSQREQPSTCLDNKKSVALEMHGSSEYSSLLPVGYASPLSPLHQPPCQKQKLHTITGWFWLPRMPWLLFLTDTHIGHQRGWNRTNCNRQSPTPKESVFLGWQYIRSTGSLMSGPSLPNRPLVLPCWSDFRFLGEPSSVATCSFLCLHFPFSSHCP